MQREGMPTRLDPIISPGIVSQHLHTITGSNMFAPTYDNPTYTTCTCPTSEVPKDCSNYWSLPVMQNLANGSFVSIPLTEVRSYYFNTVWLATPNHLH